MESQADRRPVAVALMSGGLDSTLAAAVVARQGVTVIGVNFQGAYCPGPLDGLSRAQVAATQVGIELVTLPIDAEFIATVKNPKHGRGRNMNPCIDCHTLMIRKAWEYGQKGRGESAECKVQSAGASGRMRQGVIPTERSDEGPPNPAAVDFLVTGEVLGQRPMSQNRQSLALVARESGIGDRLLRPLSAKLLEPTRPELAGLIDRERLYDIQGRTRERQFALAIEYRIKEYPQPAGGCLLTEKVYSARLREAFARGEDSVAAVELLRFGRHFRLASGSRVVLGRNRQENAELLARLPDSAALIDATSLPGPLGLLIPDSGADDRLLAARLCVAFSDKRAAGAQRVRVAAAGAAAARVEPDAVLSVAALEPDAVSRLAVQSALQSA